MPAVDLSRFEVDPKILRLVPSELANKHVVLPLKREGRTLTIAVADPTDLGLLEDLKFITRYDLFPVLAGELHPPRPHREALSSHVRAGATDAAERHGRCRRGRRGRRGARGRGRDAQAQMEDAPVVKLDQRPPDRRRAPGARISISSRSSTRSGCATASTARCSKMHEAAAQDEGRAHAAVSRSVSSLNIAERRVPQDGRLKLKMGHRVIDFRVSTLPMLFGEKIVLRILDKGNVPDARLWKFGFRPKAEEDLLRAILNPYGMVLVTGPTGSGKTTTLYSALSKHQHDRRPTS